MSQGMSEEEVKKRLYGEFREIKPVSQPVVSKPLPALSAGKKTWPTLNQSIIALAVLLMLIMVAIVVGRPGARLETAAASAAGQIKGYLAQGKQYYRDGLFDEAILTWKNVLTLEPRHRGAFRYIQKAEAKKKEVKIREEETAQKIREMLAEKEKRAKGKMFQEKEEVSRQKIKQEVARLFKEGDVYYRQGNYPAALAAYEKILPLSPGNRSAIKDITRLQVKITAEKQKLSRSRVTPKPAPLPAEEPEKGNYTIQVATCSDRAGAEAMTKQLTGRGYNQVGLKERKGKTGRIWYGVYIGSFSSREEANNLLEKIKKDGFKDSFIKTK